MCKSNIKKLPYRDNVSCIIFNKKRELLISQLKNWSDYFWKFPQGGMKEGESVTETALRELKEELGLEQDKIRVIAQAPIVHRYDWDKESITLANKRWKGQKQFYVLVEFLGNNEDIVIGTNELKDYKWVKQKELRKHIEHKHKLFIGYADTIEKVIRYFKENEFF